MNTPADHTAANQASQARLEALVARLTDADLACGLGEGWTVAAMLSHLGFYDARVIALLQRWQAGTAPAASPLDAEIINRATLAYFDLLPPRAAAELTVRLARDCDALIAALTPEQLAQQAAAGFPARLDRAHHRNEHIDQIERALAA